MEMVCWARVIVGWLVGRVGCALSLSAFEAEGSKRKKGSVVVGLQSASE
jgi:hypothetical protein